MTRRGRHTRARAPRSGTASDDDDDDDDDDGVGVGVSVGVGVGGMATHAAWRRAIARCAGARLGWASLTTTTTTTTGVGVGERIAQVGGAMRAMRERAFATRAEWTPPKTTTPTTFASGTTSGTSTSSSTSTTSANAEYEAEVARALDRACAHASPVGFTVRGLIARLRRVEREGEYELERATRALRAGSRQGGFFDMASVKRKRKKAMNKHKHRKRRRRDRHQNK